MAFGFFKKKNSGKNEVNNTANQSHISPGHFNATKEDVERLAKEAGHIISMFEHVYADKNERIKYVSALAGYACHQAVVANGEPLVKVETTDGLEYYLGDSVNYYLLEGPFSVLVFLQGCYEYKTGSRNKLDIIPVVQNAIKNIGNDAYKIWGEDTPDLLYLRTKECWNGIYQNMTGVYCKNPSEWPVLYGIVLQNIILKADVDVKESFYKALECVLFISKMDDKSIRK